MVAKRYLWKNIQSREVRLYDAKNKEYYKGYLSKKMVTEKLLHKLLDGLASDDYIFIHKGRQILIRKLHRFTYPIFLKLFNSNIDTSNVKQKVCHHTLRHSFATLAIQKSDIFLVQKLLNHKTIDMTLRYAKVDESLKKWLLIRYFRFKVNSYYLYVLYPLRFYIKFVLKIGLSFLVFFFLSHHYK